VYETFEGAFPGQWKLEDRNGSTGGWYTWDDRNCRVPSGSSSGWAVGGGSSGRLLNCFAYYPNNAASLMSFGPFSLADATTAYFAFDAWVNAQTGYDGLLPVISLDGVAYLPFDDMLTGGGSGLAFYSFSDSPLNGFLGRSQIWIGLFFASDGAWTYPEGAYVDNVVLEKCTSSNCGSMLNRLSEYGRAVETSSWRDSFTGSPRGTPSE
jgi:hypothetical protein